MTFATFSQPDNRPYCKSIPPFHKNPKELINGGQSYVLDDFTPAQALSHRIWLIYGRFDSPTGDISLIYGRSFRKDRS